MTGQGYAKRKEGEEHETHRGWIGYVAFHDCLFLDIVNDAALIRTYNEIPQLTVKEDAGTDDAPKSVRWYRLSGGEGGKNAHMAYRNRLADDMSRFWREERLGASHGR